MKYYINFFLTLSLIMQSFDMHTSFIFNELMNSVEKLDNVKNIFLNNNREVIVTAATSILGMYQGMDFVHRFVDMNNQEGQIQLDFDEEEFIEDDICSIDTYCKERYKFKITDKMLQDVVLKKMDINVPNLHQRPELEMVPGLECEDVNQWAYYRIAENKRTKYLEYENNRIFPPVRYSSQYDFKNGLAEK